MPKTAPYGTWKSPIGADLITQKAISLSDILVDPVTNELYHLEGRPSEGGRVVLVRSHSNEDAVGSDWNVRTQVHEYGGGAATVYGGDKIYFSDFKSKRIFMIDGKAAPIPVTPENPNLRFANMAVFPGDPRFIVAVQEDHANPAPADVVNTLVSIDCTSQTVTTLASGADFYSSPCFSPDGRHIAWLEWIHPDMPWEGSQLRVAKISVKETTLTISDVQHIAGKPDTSSANEPNWLNNDRLIYQCDTSGFYNPYIYSLVSAKSEPALQEPVSNDFSDPAWVFGMSRMAVLDENTVVVSPIHQGFSKLALIPLDKKSLVELECPYTSISYVRRLTATSVAMSATKDDSATALVVVDIANQTPAFKVVKETSTLAATLPPGYISTSQAFALNNGNLYTIVNLPKNADYTSTHEEKPPAVINIHGGPTARVPPGLSWITQYFTSRGWAWVDVNYSGSSGYGREYQERLRGQWGVADVLDAALAVKELGEKGIIDPKRAVIRGGSAGGFTVLMALCTPETAGVFAAGNSLYGVSDLNALVEDTHKFESQYLFKLVGGTPKEVPDVYAARSAVNHADQIQVPLLILQGSDDHVVPPNQAEAIVKKIREKGGEVEYIVFEGEGHGWRRAENVKAALEKECQFYEKVFNLTPD